MNCDRCDNEATVHELTVVNGVSHEKHLCEQCAAQDGVVFGSDSPVTELIGKLAASIPDEPSIEVVSKSPTCGACGTTFAQFRQTGLLGCAQCYFAFEDRLAPMIERAHEGASQHVGKTPKRALEASRRADGGKPIDQILADASLHAQQVQLLRKQLDEAVAAEQYERAATLRDELTRMEARSFTPETGETT